jgi:hypothetical protein
MIVAAVSWLMLALVLKKKSKAALLVSLALLLFFSFGHLEDTIGRLFVTLSAFIGPKKISLSLTGLLFAAGAFFIIRTRRSLAFVTSLANSVSTILVTVSIITIAFGLLRSPRILQSPVQKSAKTAVAGDPLSSAYPDIYYIILDGYGRADVLRELYNYDNDEFLEHLAARGFFIATEARTNYCQTALSLGSSLNMRYLDPVADHLDLGSSDRTPLARLISQNAVMEFLHGMGYTSVAFSTGYYDTEIRTADVYLDPGVAYWFLDEFQNGLLGTTPLPILLSKLDRFSFLPTGIGRLQSDTHRNRILYTLSHLERIPSRPGPHFVFAHIILPHPPFLFGPDGEHIYPEGVFSMSDGSHMVGPTGMAPQEYVRKYSDQLSYANQLIKNVVDSILTHSPRPPIIILQGDHGPGSQLDWENLDNTNARERLTILNAYYLPDGGDSCLYNGISPVNSFRLIFNHYFGTRYELLDDRSFYSTWAQPYDFRDVTERLSTNIN